MGAQYTLSATLIGGPAIKAAIERGASMARNEVAKALNKAANDAHNIAVQKAPHQTGRLWGSLHVENASSSNLIARLGTNLIYARAQELGTQGMIIHSHSKRGKPFTYIGNIKPKYYLRDAKEAVRPKLTNYLQTAANRIVQEMAID